MDMGTRDWVLVAVGAAVVVVAVVVLLVIASRRYSAHRSRTDALRRRFAQEYDVTIARLGQRKGEQELEERMHRFRDIELDRVKPDTRLELTEEWKEAQYRFLEDPVYSVREAEHLIVGLMRERGLPHGDFDTRVRALSVAHPELAEPYRSANATSRAAEDGQATIDAMFRAMLQYRTLFEVLLERPKREDGVEGSAPPATAGWVSSGAGVAGASGDRT